MKKAIDFVKPAVILLLVAAVVALVLGGVNALTENPIKLNQQKKVEKAIQAVVPAGASGEAEEEAAPAISYTKLEPTPEGVDTLYQIDGGGWVVQVTKTGSQGAVTMMVGVSEDLTCTGISITKSSETAGLGAIASQQSEKGDTFRAQFVGQSGEVKVDKDGGDIDSITGATITSRAVCAGVTDALAVCANLG